MKSKKVEAWANDPKTFKGDVCVHGDISGGTGYFGFCLCEHPDHCTVRYGRDVCPDNCKDFVKVEDESELFRRFMLLFNYKYDEKHLPE